MHHAFLYIFLPSLWVRRGNAHFHVSWRTWTQDHDFLFLFLKFDTVFYNSTPEKIANICQIERDGISVIKFEAANWLLEWRFRRRRCRCCVRLLNLLHVAAQSLKPVKLLATYKRTQQLPTMLVVVSRGLTVSGADFSTSFKSELIQNPEPKIGNPLADWWVTASFESFSAVENLFSIQNSTFHVSKKKQL